MKHKAATRVGARTAMSRAKRRVACPSDRRRAGTRTVRTPRDVDRGCAWPRLRPCPHGSQRRDRDARCIADVATFAAGRPTPILTIRVLISGRFAISPEPFGITDVSIRGAPGCVGLCVRVPERTPITPGRSIRSNTNRYKPTHPISPLFGFGSRKPGVRISPPRPHGMSRVEHGNLDAPKRRTDRPAASITQRTGDRPVADLTELYTQLADADGR
jgi:hypothetical protein